MEEIILDDYDDNYDTCEKTYATLRIYSQDIHPDEISKILGLSPSRYQVKGENLPHSVVQTVPLNGWFLTSEGKIDSRDARRHIDYVISKVYPKKDKILRLQSKKTKFDISCYWSSTQGQGGPTLSPKQMKSLAELNIDIWFDIY